MNVQNVFKQLNIIAQCRYYNLPLRQCPQFLFVLMGFLICLNAIVSYLISIRCALDSLLVALVILFASIFFFILDVLIVKSFERLAEANRMKSEFVNIVSHQLRSPLSNLSWVLELLMSGRLGEIKKEHLDYFKTLEENLSRMKDLVFDLLAVSRLQEASLPLDKREFSLVERTKKVLSGFEPFARTSNIKLDLEFEDDLPSVYGDPAKIGLAVENLLDNAIRYAKHKGRVEIKIERCIEGIRFEIRDNGIGIPEEDQKFIFQKFFKSKNVSGDQSQGSGLGLFISKLIIQKSGGQIGFQSKEGKGSMFWFTLPITK